MTNEYIRGLIEGEGCFSFHTTGKAKRLGGERYHIPVFAIAMHERDWMLIRKMRDTLGLRNKVYIHHPSNTDGYKRGKRASLYVRDFQQLRDIIIPLCYQKLHGYKGKQLIAWLEKIGNDPSVTDGYKLLHRLHKSGYFSRKENLNRFP